MQKDMHFYGTYAVARIAGFAPGEALTVATASQYVDDSTLADPVSLNGQAYLLPVVSSHGMFELIKNSNAIDQWHVWLPFHFLPGNKGNDAERRLICLWGEPDNLVAEAVLNLALNERDQDHGLHLLGVVSHVLQDTYAHYGFCGIASDRNRIDERTLKILNRGSLDAWFKGVHQTFVGRFTGSVASETRLGHASVATFPDLPYLKWSFQYEAAPGLDLGYGLDERDNPESYYRACTRLHALFRAYRDGLPSIGESDGHVPFESGTEAAIRSTLNTIEDDKEKRCGLWRERIADGSFFVPLAQDKEVVYNTASWQYQFLEGNAGAALTHAYRFNQAARRYLDAVLTDVLPGANLLMI